MGIPLFVSVSVLIAFPQGKPAPSIGPKAVIAEARQLAGGLTSRSERTAAFLAIARAQERVGDPAGALASLRLGWNAYEKSSDMGLSPGDRFDAWTLFDEYDFASIPLEYAYEFVVQGDLALARRAAMSLGDSSLADSFREGLGHRLREKYPQAVEAVTMTAAQQVGRVVRKAQLAQKIETLRAEKDAGKRSFGLYEISGEIERVGDGAQALALMREAAEASAGIDNAYWRAVDEAQIAMVLWRLGPKSEAQDLLARAEKDFSNIVSEEDRPKATFAIEQTKRVMGLPVTPASSAPSTSTPSAPMSASNSPSALLAGAEGLAAKGDVAAAKKVLRRIKSGSGDDGWWLVLAGEMQTKLGDREGARLNLNEGSRRTIASLRPSFSFNRDLLSRVERIANDQVANGDSAAAVKTLSLGIARLAGGQRWSDIPSLGDHQGQIVRYDRQSPLLHAGVVTLAKAGFYSRAVEVARTIPSRSHRTIALAMAVYLSAPDSHVQKPK